LEVTQRFFPPAKLLSDRGGDAVADFEFVAIVTGAVEMTVTNRDGSAAHFCGCRSIDLPEAKSHGRQSGTGKEWQIQRHGWGRFREFKKAVKNKCGKKVCLL
jgi:hypothetical protein